MRPACACLLKRFRKSPGFAWPNSVPDAFLHPRFVRIPRFEFPVREYASFESTHNSNTNRDRTYAISSPPFPFAFISPFAFSFPPSHSCSRTHQAASFLPFTSFLRVSPFICVQFPARFPVCLASIFRFRESARDPECLHATRVCICPHRKCVSEIALTRSPALRATPFIHFVSFVSFIPLVIFPSVAFGVGDSLALPLIRVLGSQPLLRSCAREQGRRARHAFTIMREWGWGWGVDHACSDIRR